MNLAPMRYKDYVWPHNPETYTISFKRIDKAIPPIVYAPLAFS